MGIVIGVTGVILGYYAIKLGFLIEIIIKANRDIKAYDKEIEELERGYVRG